MRTLPLLAATFLLTATQAQYGTYDAKLVGTAKATSLVVVLDDGDSPYNRSLMEAVKADWKFNGSYEFVTLKEMAARPIVPTESYLLKTLKQDPEKHTGTHLSLVMGWKQKKGETLQTTGGAVTNIPSGQELAHLLIDPERLNTPEYSPYVKLYVKHLQNYLELVMNGKITDKTTADRTYQGRNRLLRDNTTFVVDRRHLDKTMADDPSKVSAVYPKGAKVTETATVVDAIEGQDASITVTDVVLTGDHKTKWCFKRVFNAGTGELMYLKDEAALYGKKEGFMDEDFKQIDRAR
ncbi:MAG: hypothetical protein JNM31_04140 [Flavobacteriales bacterium]|nr:hypothetical protein [Flavobacteriales bacterium]